MSEREDVIKGLQDLAIYESNWKHEANDAIKLIEQRAAEIKAYESLTAKHQRQIEHHAEKLRRDDGPCYYCGENTNFNAGDPCKWPVSLPHEDDPGVMKPHHIGCVLERLAVIDKLPKTKDGVCVLDCEGLVYVIYKGGILTCSIAIDGFSTSLWRAECKTEWDGSKYYPIEDSYSSIEAAEAALK